MIRQVEYFEKSGRGNTDACISIIQQMLKEEDFEYVVVASTTGESALRLKEALSDTPATIVVVTHSAGFKEINQQEFDEEIRAELDQAGIPVHTATILTHSLETALSLKYSGVMPTQLIAQTLRRFGEGSKVCCECVMEAADAGLIPEAERVIAVGGTGRGWDTVCVIRSAASKRFLDLYVSEVRAKPL